MRPAGSRLAGLSAIVALPPLLAACEDAGAGRRPEGAASVGTDARLVERIDSIGRIDHRAGDPPPDGCAAPDAALALDHVVVAVEDLGAAVDGYSEAGFTIKPGRPHENGLLNAHLKFVDGTQLELMSVERPPIDAIARGYRDFLRGGEGGAFVAFRALHDRVLQESRRSGIRADSLGRAYVVYPDIPRIFALRHGLPRRVDPDSLLTHPNGAEGMTEVWLEGGDAVARLLVALGGRDCGTVEPPEGTGTTAPGRVFAVANGRVVLLPPEKAERPLVRGVVLPSRRTPPPPFVPPDRAHGLWIRFTGP